MITKNGCQQRRERLLERLRPVEPLLLGDPLNLRYLAGFDVDPFSLGADFGGLLLLEPDGHTTLYHDNRLPKSIAAAHVDDRKPISWYDGQSPGIGPRRTILRTALDAIGIDIRIHDALDDSGAVEIHRIVSEMRRRKGPDEVAMLLECMRATEAGHAWARTNIRAGMTELDVYLGVAAACQRAAGRAVIVYGDFAVSPGSARRGGPPTDSILRDGETFILDFSVVIRGYRSDFTNTVVVGGSPNADQTRLFNLCLSAMTSGEQQLRAGVDCLVVYRAVREVFESSGMARFFPHHAGHGIGLSHPEAPFLVERATETLVAGDVVTLEPGLYVDGVGGIRLEHNYLITDSGFERLSNHSLSLT